MEESDCQHVMIDIETMSTSTKAVVLQVGAVRFDKNGIYESMQVSPCPRGQIKDHGRIMDMDTLLWWSSQPSWGRVLGDAIRDLSLVSDQLEALRSFMHKMNTKAVKVWANSPTFDLAILRDLYKDYGTPVPWSFRNERDMRTLMDCVPKGCKVKRDLHIAVEDAKDQAESVIKAWQWFDYIDAGGLTKKQGGPS